MATYSRAPSSPDNLPLALLLLAGAAYLYQRNRAGTGSAPPLDIGTLFGPTPLDLTPRAGGTQAGTTSPKITTPAPGAPTGSPRGIRNNNPLNIEWSLLNPWQEQDGSDGRFSRFKSPVYGLRAAFKLLRTYHTAHGINTIAGLAARWAPAPENNPVSYAASASSAAGIGANTPLDFNSFDTMMRVVRGFISVEDGSGWTNFYSADLMRQAWDLAT